MSQLRVQFVHGLASSPQGAQARLFAQHFEALTPAMAVEDFEGCVAQHAAALESFRPDVLIGSSFGGAVAVVMLERGLWRGPTLLLAQAALHYRPHARLPSGVPVLLVHGLHDEVVPIEQSRALAATGQPDCVELVELDDDHALSLAVQSGELLALVRRAGELRLPRSQPAGAGSTR